jgi:hypothetical protein
MINFDERGHLSKPFELNMSQFQELFVDKWPPETSTRHAIFDTFEKYLADFQDIITPDFEMWIDGSFVTQKSNPQDIDFVSFIDYTVYFKEVKLIDNQFNKYGTKTFYGKLLDGYVSPIYPEGHKDAYDTRANEVYWFNQFSSTKPDRFKKKYSKGFIKIKFNSHG